MSTSKTIINNVPFDSADLTFPPSGRRFRNNWAVSNNVVTVDEEGVREVAHEVRRKWRKFHEDSGFTYNGKQFHSDENSSNKIDGAARAAELQEAAVPGSFTIQWSAIDNTLETLDLAGMRAFFLAVFTHHSGCFSNSEIKKAAIDAAIGSDAIITIIDTMEAEMNA